jgi:ariadne-1
MQAEEVRPEMNLRCKDVGEMLGISVPAAFALLRASNWSKEGLLEKYMNDSDRILRKAGVYHRCGHEVDTMASRKSAALTCSICFDDCDSMLPMPCGHAFCYDCWKDFCVNAIEEGPSCVSATCPDATCSEVVTEIEVASALGESSLDLTKYKSFQLRSFVESNPLSRWCPSPGCERIAYALSQAAMEAEGSVAACDSCLMSFCLICGEEPHAPASCKCLEKWNEKCRNESETANWILANTKSCPKCHSRIEKNQGCNHMTCQKCRFEFCWICMGDWHDHGANTGGYYKCNKYDNDGGEEDTSDAGKAKRELDRYLHFYSRFHAHSEAQAFAKRQLKETEHRMVQLQESSDDARWSDVEFLKAANEQLVDCRRVLKYTYVYAFYMLDGSTSDTPGTKKRSSSNAGNSSSAANALLSMQRDRFEYHQEMLERFTENLSELSEKPLPEMDRTDVVNQTRVVDRFMKNILKYVEDGMDDDSPTK